MNALKLVEEVKVLNLTMDVDVKQIHVVGRPRRPILKLTTKNV
jgi:hypothetical protein